VRINFLYVLGEAKNFAGGTEYFINNAIVDGATPVSGQDAAFENRVCADKTAINVFFYFRIHANPRFYLLFIYKIRASDMPPDSNPLNIKMLSWARIFHDSVSCKSVKKTNAWFHGIA